MRLTPEEIRQDLDILLAQRAAVENQIVLTRKRLAEALCPFKVGDAVVWSLVRGGITKRDGRVVDIQPYNLNPRKVIWRLVVERPDGDLASITARQDPVLA